MFAVIFEVQPKPERWDTYLDLAKFLKPRLEQTEGFIDNERFESKRTKGRVLSLSTWRDEKALVRWRTHDEHHQVQGKGRFEVFEDYHLRVGEITTAQRDDATEVGRAKVLTITEILPAKGAATQWQAGSLRAALALDANANGLIDSEVFASLYTKDKLLLLASWTSAGQAIVFSPESQATLESFRHRQVMVIRDYGMRDRREAPQYYASVSQPPGD